MVNSKKVIAGLGVVAGLGVAMLPLTSYAETTGTQTVRATVEEVLAITVENNKSIAADNDNAVAMDQNDLDTTLLHTINVTGNIYNGYTLNLKANDSADLRLVTSAASAASKTYSDSVKIPALTTPGALEAGTAGWGYKFSDTTTFSSENWTGVTTAGADIKNFTNTDHAAFNNNHYVSYGIATDDDQGAGTYETTVTYTVTANSL